MVHFAQVDPEARFAFSKHSKLLSDSDETNTVMEFSFKDTLVGELTNTQ